MQSACIGVVLAMALVSYSNRNQWKWGSCSHLPIFIQGKGKMKTYWLLGNKNYSVQNDSLVCHWNPAASRKKKPESSLTSVQQVPNAGEGEVLWEWLKHGVSGFRGSCSVCHGLGGTCLSNPLQQST